MTLVDSHCHLTHERLVADEAAVVERAREAGLVACVTIGTGIDDARAALALAARHPGFVHVAAGLDPFTCHRLGDGFEAALAELAALLDGGGVVALGEVGLDFHYDLDSPALQAARLDAQLELARDAGLPVVIHVREAHEAMADVLARHPGVRGVIHSFTGGPAEAEAYLALDWHLAFNGVATFKNAAAVREAARLVPEGRLLLETDSPYLAPVPMRGRRCEPAYVAETARRLAAERGVDPGELAATTTAAARALFGI